MTLLFTAVGIVFFIAIGYRFATKVISREPLTDRAK
jgi:uncharacterized protein YneF (UPF0154 family)